MMLLNSFSVPFFSAGTTNTAGAIRSAYSEMFTSSNGDQNGADNVDIVFTDGRSDDYAKTWEEARNARYCILFPQNIIHFNTRPKLLVMFK